MYYKYMELLKDNADRVMVYHNAIAMALLNPTDLRDIIESGEWLAKTDPVIGPKITIAIDKAQEVIYLDREELAAALMELSRAKTSFLTSGDVDKEVNALSILGLSAGCIDLAVLIENGEKELFVDVYNDVVEALTQPTHKRT